MKGQQYLNPRTLLRSDLSEAYFDFLSRINKDRLGLDTGDVID